MTRVKQGSPIQTNVVQTKVPPEIRKRFDALSDISGLSAPEILRHCIHRALADVEAEIQSGVIPPEPFLVKQLKTKPHQLEPIPLKSEIGAPPTLLALIQNGVFPDGYEAEEIPEWELKAMAPPPPPAPEPEPEPAPEPPAPKPRRRRRG